MEAEAYIEARAYDGRYVVKISLYDREAEWLASMPDELVLMNPGPARVAENGATVGLSRKFQT
jgi:hypothetical protein